MPGQTLAAVPSFFFGLKWSWCLEVLKPILTSVRRREDIKSCKWDDKIEHYYQSDDQNHRHCPPFKKYLSSCNWHLYNAAKCVAFLKSYTWTGWWDLGLHPRKWHTVGLLCPWAMVARSDGAQPDASWFRESVGRCRQLRKPGRVVHFVDVTIG